MATVTLPPGSLAPSESPNRPPPFNYIQACRPWHSLYGVRLRRIAEETDAVRACLAASSQLRLCGQPGVETLPASSLTQAPTPAPNLQPEKELSLIEKLISEELLLLVFNRLPLASLGAAQVVCRQWRAVGGSPSLWRAACAEAFQAAVGPSNEEVVLQTYQGCWKTVRFGGWTSSVSTARPRQHPLTPVTHPPIHRCT